MLFDSGVRRGTDVLKALALGAQFVFIGRPFLYAAAIAGESGVRHAIKLLKDEVDRDMALLGITTLAEMRRELLTDARGFGEHGPPRLVCRDRDRWELDSDRTGRPRSLRVLS